MPPVAPVLVNRNGQSPLWREEDIDELGTVILPSEASHEDVDFADLICSRRRASRLLNGSSSKSSRGSATSARASESLCCWPPLNCAAERDAKAASPIVSRVRITRWRMSS